MWTGEERSELCKKMRKENGSTYRAKGERERRNEEGEGREGDQ